MATSDWQTIDSHGMQLALEEATKSYEQGGIPIGSALLVLDEAEPKGYRVLGSGHNERIQRSSPTLHGEISALENAGRLKASTYRRATIVSQFNFCHERNSLHADRKLLTVHDAEVKPHIFPLHVFGNVSLQPMQHVFRRHLAL